VGWGKGGVIRWEKFAIMERRGEGDFGQKIIEVASKSLVEKRNDSGETRKNNQMKKNIISTREEGPSQKDQLSRGEAEHSRKI